MKVIISRAERDEESSQWTILFSHRGTERTEKITNEI
jgi:hypothetical protein